MMACDGDGGCRPEVIEKLGRLDERISNLVSEVRSYKESVHPRILHIEQTVDDYGRKIAVQGVLLKVVLVVVSLGMTGAGAGKVLKLF